MELTAQSPMLRALLDASLCPLSDWPTCHRDQQALGYLCSYAPLELVQAAGLAPVRLRASHAPVRSADSVLQSYACALCRSTLDQMLSGELSFMRGVLFAHTCDAMQALADLWRMHAPGNRWVDCVMHPTNLGSPATPAYLCTELGRIRDRLAQLAGGAIRDEHLSDSIALYNRTRRLVQTLHHHRDRLTASQFYAILDAAQMLPRKRFNTLLAGALTELQTLPSADNGPRLYLLGAALDEPGLLGLLTDLHAQVVGDDLCSGMRPYLGEVAEDIDPIQALTDYALLRSPCPAKLAPGVNASRELLEQVRSVHADGVVFVLQKFCDPHAFDRARLLPALERAGIPHLLLELELTPNLEGLSTRLQAFIEIL